MICAGAVVRYVSSDAVAAALLACVSNGASRTDMRETTEAADSDISVIYYSGLRKKGRGGTRQDAMARNDEGKEVRHPEQERRRGNPRGRRGEADADKADQIRGFD